MGLYPFHFRRLAYGHMPYIWRERYASWPRDVQGWGQIEIYHHVSGSMRRNREGLDDYGETIAG